jgi:hypothetical protein
VDTLEPAEESCAQDVAPPSVEALEYR